MMHDEMGDPRRCRRHPDQPTSSPDGMFDTPCPACEEEADRELESYTSSRDFAILQIRKVDRLLHPE